jgi:AraC family transcriptional regulator of adaptative response / DNA-3-methyladenine glycosylase II
VALVSGFASVRRFNAAFSEHYGLSPERSLRREGASAKPAAVRLGYRPPYDVQRCSASSAPAPSSAWSWSMRQQPGAHALHRSRRAAHTGWLQAEFDEDRCQLLLRVSDSLRGVLPLVIRRVRAAFDLDADPHAINARLHGSFPLGDGLRVPGARSAATSWRCGPCWASRSRWRRRARWRSAWCIASASRSKRRSGLDRLFPAAEVLAAAEGDALGQLGIVRQRQAAIVAIARAVAEGRVHLHAGADVPATVACA